LERMLRPGQSAEEPHKEEDCRKRKKAVKTWENPLGSFTLNERKENPNHKKGRKIPMGGGGGGAEKKEVDPEKNSREKQQRQQLESPGFREEKGRDQVFGLKKVRGKKSVKKSPAIRIGTV